MCLRENPRLPESRQQKSFKITRLCVFEFGSNLHEYCYVIVFYYSYIVLVLYFFFLMQIKLLFGTDLHRKAVLHLC